MSEVAELEAQASSNVPAVRPQREVRVVESDNPVMSTASFEHLVRIARLMADSAMMPESLTMIGKGPNKTWLDDRVIVARAFMIAEQAAGWRRSPFALMGHASFVHGKLCWEGKLVNAILTDDYGIDLDYEWGIWVAETETCDLTQGEGAGDLLAVRVSGMVNGRKQFIDGSVGTWKTTGDGSPWRPGAMKRQCRYRGQREWARAYRSGAMLGVMVDDEVEPQFVRAQVQAPTLAGAHGDTAQIEHQPRGRRRKAAEAASPPPVDDQVVDGEFTDATDDGAPQGTGGAQTADEGQGSQVSATDVSGDSAGETSSQDDTSQASGDGAAGDADPQSAAGAASPGTQSSLVEPASDAGTETGAGSPGTGAPTSGGDDVRPDVVAYETGLRNATVFLQARESLVTFRKTATYRETEDEGKRMWQIQLLERMGELAGAGKEVPTPEADPWVFSIWVQTPPPAAAVKAAFAKLMGTDAYQRLNEAQQDALASAADNAMGVVE